MVSFPVGLFLALFTMAMLSLWVPLQRGRFVIAPWCLFASSLAVCLYQGWLQPLALIWLITLSIAAWLFHQTLNKVSDWRHYLSFTLVTVISLGLATHQLPGFSDIPVLADESYRNLDKACVAFILLALLLPRITRWGDLRNAFSKSWRLFLLAPLVIFSLADLLGGLENVGFGIPQYFWLWAWGNLLVTCVAEELFFRGFLQRYLTLKWSAKRWGWQSALCLTSLLFGLVHLAGGVEFAVIATIAGLFYGLVYHLSGRIEIAILLHFLINLLYLLLRS